jgi:competence protein ComEC
MTLERPPLFTKTRDGLIFFSFVLLLFVLSLTHKYTTFSTLTQFNDAVIEANVLNQYIKTTPTKKYTVLKLRSDSATFYTTAPIHLKNLIGRKIALNVWVKHLTFFEYIKGFYLHSKIIKVFPEKEPKTILAHHLTLQHDDTLSGELFAALFTASPISKDLRSHLCALGVSHLLAISGFHLGIISALLFFIFKLPYRLIQERYFPYRSAHRDLFLVVTLFLTAYLYFLGAIPSLLRAFMMLIIGFVLYDRGIKVLSMQTLFLTLSLLIAFMPSLLFSMGFWLSIIGVFYILLYLVHFQSERNIYNFIGLSIWVYVMMLPLSLYLFHTFSIYHPLSILATLLFLPFYVISTFLHLISQGGVLDHVMPHYLYLGETSQHISISFYMLALEATLSLLAIQSKKMAYLLLLFCFFVFIRTIYHVAEF